MNQRSRPPRPAGEAPGTSPRERERLEQERAAIAEACGDETTKSGRKQSLFTKFARATSRWTGRPAAFLLAVGVVVVWACTGPVFQYSDTWQLVINTGTTVVTFLMVFLIQNSQNRDSEAIQLKLDELIRAIEGAENKLIDLEEMDEEQLRAVHKEYAALAAKAHARLERDRAAPEPPAH